MQTTNTIESATSTVEIALPKDPRAIRILAKTVYKDLCTSGYNRAQVVAFTSELLDLVTNEIEENQS